MKIGFFEAVRRGFANFARFGGRAQVAEFWWWVLFVWGAGLAMAIAESTLRGTYTLDGHCFGPALTGTCTFFAFNGGPVTAVVMLVLMIPSLAVFSRRLHDTNHRFWWILLDLVPLVGVIILIVWTATPGTRGANRFGADPLGPVGSSPDPG